MSQRNRIWAFPLVFFGTLTRELGIVRTVHSIGSAHITFSNFFSFRFSNPYFQATQLFYRMYYQWNERASINWMLLKQMRTNGLSKYAVRSLRMKIFWGKKGLFKLYLPIRNCCGRYMNTWFIKGYSYLCQLEICNDINTTKSNSVHRFMLCLLFCCWGLQARAGFLFNRTILVFEQPRELMDCFSDHASLTVSGTPSRVMGSSYRRAQLPHRKASLGVCRQLGGQNPSTFSTLQLLILDGLFF